MTNETFCLMALMGIVLLIASYGVDWLLTFWLEFRDDCYHE